MTPKEDYDTMASIGEIKLRHDVLLNGYARYVTELDEFSKLAPGDNEFLAVAAKLAGATCELIELRAALLIQCTRT